MTYYDYKENFTKLGLQCDGSWAFLVSKIISEYLKVYKEPLDILEIGRYVGTSFGFFRYLLPKSYIMSLDIQHNPKADNMAKSIYENFKNVVGKYDFITDDSLNLLKYTNKKKFDLILIDGGHSCNIAKRDLELSCQTIKDHGIILFDDMDHPAGCGRAFDEFLAKKDFCSLKFNATTDFNHSPNFGILYSAIQKEVFKSIEDIPVFVGIEQWIT